MGRDLIKHYAYKKRHYGNKLKLLHRYKVMKGCAKCGYNESPYALQFDHLDPSTKSRRSLLFHRLGKESLKKEIKKCQILCANCHMIKTYEDN